MDYIQFLQQFGLDQTKVEYLIMMGVIAFVVGMFLYMFWTYIVLALGAFAILVVMSHHGPDHIDVAIPDRLPELKIPNIPIDPKQVEREEIMEDCESLTHDHEICRDHVAQRSEAGTIVEEVKQDEFKPAAEVKPLDVDNPAYNMLRATAMQLPGAVVLHSILR